MSSPTAEGGAAGPRPAAALGLLGLISLGLGLAYAVPTVDPVAHWVLELVAQIPEGGWWRPFSPPPPAYGFGFRPLSVLLMQAYIAALGPQAAPPPALLFVKVAGGLWVFGAAAWAWLRAFGAGRAALPLAALSLGLAPQLFSAAGLTEFDGLGAAMTLLLSLCLRRLPARPALLGLLPPLLLLILTLKESAALIAFGVLAAHIIEHALSGARRWAAGLVALSTAAGLLWLAGAWQVIEVPHNPLHFEGLDPRLRLQIWAYAGAQLLVFAPLPAVLLAWAAALLPRLPAPARGPALALAALGLCALPLAAVANHYEAYYSDQAALMVLGGPLVLAPLAALALRPRARARLRLPLLLVLGPMAALAPAVLLASNPREDLASRLFLVVVPPLWLLLAEAAAVVEAHLPTEGPGRLGRAARGALIGAAAWAALAGGLNATALHRARNAVDSAGTVALAQLPLRGALVMFDQFGLFRTGHELQAHLPGGALPDGLQHMFCPTQLRWAALPMLSHNQHTDAEREWRRGRTIYLYSLGLRSLEAGPARAALHGDLRGLRHPFGVFQPLEVEGGPGPAPVQNPLEDARAATYGADPDPLARLAAARGAERLRRSARVWLLPVQLHELPRRLAAGVGLLEDAELRLILTEMHHKGGPVQAPAGMPAQRPPGAPPGPPLSPR